MFYKIFCIFTLNLLTTAVLSDLSSSQLKDCTQFVNETKLLALEPGLQARVCSVFLDVNTPEQLSPDSPRGRPQPYEVWGYGLLMVTLISLTSVVGVGVMPLMSRAFYSNLLTCLIGLAVGSLAGSAVFHLIPSAFRLADVDLYPHHSYLNISLSIWAGLYLFFIIERFLKIFMDAKARKQGETIHGHSHGQPLSSDGSVMTSSVLLTSNGDCEDDSSLQRSVLLSPDSQEEEVKVKVLNGNGEFEDDDDPRKTCNGMLEDKTELYSTSKTAIRASFGHQDRPHPMTRPTVEGVRSLSTKSGNKIATVAWMIIFGDGIHNFIDGLSIGAAFSESILTGISVSLAVLCEEFPHELGDFAVLLNSGMSVKQAMAYNFLSACTCYLGLVLGILLGELDGTNVYIFALAGGMFLYISLVDMVPELNQSVEDASRVSVREALATFSLQNLGILVGIACLYTLARYQDDIAISL